MLANLDTWRYAIYQYDGDEGRDADTTMQAYLKQLQTNPLRTKMLTSGTLSALQEILASWIAKDRAKNGTYFTARVPKMAAYGAFISAPLGHVLISILQKLFAGRTSLKAKILQIIFSNLIVSSILDDICNVSNQIITDRSHPEQCLLGIDGHHCWCQDDSSSSCDLESRIHACHEGQLDLVSSLPRLRSEVPPRAHLGPLLQHCRILHRHIRQFCHKEEASRGTP